MEDVVVVGVTCDVCRSGIIYPICFQLNPCLHRACVRCFHEFMPAGVFHRCPCQDCREWISSSTLLELEGTSSAPKKQTETTRNNSNDIYTINNDDASLLREVQEVPHFQPDEQMDPFRHWSIQKPNLYTGLIYVAYRCSENNATFYKSNFKAYDSTVFMDDESTDEMVKIFARILHPILFQQGRDNNDNDNDNHGGAFNQSKGGDESSLSPPPSPPPPRLLDPDRNANRPMPHDARLIDCYTRQDRQHLAMRCMYALSAGRVLTPAEQDEKFGGTTKNLNHNNNHNDVAQTLPVLASTQQLARELLKAYQTSCMKRKEHEVERSPEEPASASSPTQSPPAPIVHDLRPHRYQGSEHPTRHSTKAVYKEHNLIPLNDEGDDLDDERASDNIKYSESGGDRFWENELGLNELCRNKENETNDDFENPSSPIVPAILWILSAVFILSK